MGCRAPWVGLPVGGLPQNGIRFEDSCAFAQFEGADEALVAFANEEEAAKLAASSC